MYNSRFCFNRKIIAAILIVSITISMLYVGSFESYADDALTFNNEEVIVGQTTYYPNMGSAKPVTYYYSDGYFTCYSKFDNEHLATASMAMAMSTMNNTGGKQAVEFLERIGCTNIEKMGYDRNAEDNVAAVYGKKNILTGHENECILVPVALRGAFYGDEWINNFDVGDSGDARGFATAAEKVKDELDSYVKGFPSNKKVRFWLAGYSRGGSIGNILGKLLSDEYGKENVYGYSFESQSASTAENAEEYTNLKVFKNYNDILAMLYPVYMGFADNGSLTTIGNTDDPDCSETAMITQLDKINTRSDKYATSNDFQYVKLNSDILTIANTNINSISSAKKVIQAVLNIYQKGSEYEIFVEDSPSTSQYSQNDCNNVVLNRLQIYALKDREAYVSNNDRLISTAINKSKSIDFNSVKIDGASAMSVQDTAKAMMAFFEETPDAALDTIVEVFKEFPVSDYINTSSLSEISESYKNILKIQAVLRFFTKLELTGVWDGNTPTERYNSMLNWVWGVLNTPSKDGKYPGVSKISGIPEKDLKEGLPILVYTLAAYSSQDVGQTPETIATLINNDDFVAQAHYPEINFAWLCTEDSFYGGKEHKHTHSNVHYDAKAATCKEGGWGEYDVCSECGYSTKTLTPKLDHSLKHIKKAAGNCKDGEEYDQCTRCNAIFNKKVINGYSTYYVKSFKVSKGNKAFTAKWKKQSKSNQKKFSGYQIRYSTKSSMAGAKYVTAKKSSSSKKISKLKKKTKYYVQVRTYRTVGGKKYYSTKWSSKKSIKTK